MEKQVIADEEIQTIKADKTVIKSVKNQTQKLWNNLYIKMLIVGLLLSICQNMLNTTLPLYVQELGADKSIAGLVTGVFTIAALVVRPIYGNLADIKSRKLVLIIGISIMAATIFGLTLTTSIFIILVIRTVMGVGFSGFSTAGGTVVADVVPDSRISEGIGYYGISANIATACGPQIALVLIASCGYNSVFYSSLVIILLGLFLVMTFNYEKRAKKERESQEGYVEPPKTKASLKSAFEKAAIPGSITQFFWAMPMGFAMTFMATFGITEGIDNIGMYFTVFALALLSTRFFVGKLADKYGIIKIVIPGIILVFIGIIMLAFSHTLTLVLIAAGFIGFGYGCVNPTINAYIIKVSPLNRRGAANATYYAAFDGGVGLGSMAGGFIVQTMGFQNAFFSLAGVVVLGFLYFNKFVRRQIAQIDAQRAIA